MKKLIFILCLSLAAQVSAQHTINEKKEYTENGITRGWVITKELDRKGNVLSYDSSYYEHAADPNDFGNMDLSTDPFGDFGTKRPDIGSSMPDFGAGMPKFGEDGMPDFDEFTKTMMDFTESMFSMTDSLMGMFIGPNRLPQMDKFDGYMDQLDEMDGMDSFHGPKEEKLVIPDKQKKKNRKT